METIMFKPNMAEFITLQSVSPCFHLGEAVMNKAKTIVCVCVGVCERISQQEDCST